MEQSQDMDNRGKIIHKKGPSPEMFKLGPLACKKKVLSIGWRVVSNISGLPLQEIL
jgi:hypothetical protein